MPQHRQEKSAKTIGIACMYKSTASFIAANLEILFADAVVTKIYCFEDDSLCNGVQADLVLAPSHSLLQTVRPAIADGAETVVVKRTLSKKGMDKLVRLPKGTRAMLVNSHAEMAVETISLIYQLGIHHIDLVPVYPGMTRFPDLSVAITPGETKHVPAGVATVVDIGDRVLDISTVMDIIAKLGLDYLRLSDRLAAYAAEIVPASWGMQDILDSNSRLEGEMANLLQLLDEGVIGVDTRGIIYTYSDTAGKILDRGREDVLGRPAANCLPEVPFAQVLTQAEAREQIIRINDTDIAVSVKPVFHAGVLQGAVAFLKRYSEAERRQYKLRAQILQKGHKAKYSFADIRGESAAIVKCKDIARRMARSDSSVLIYGESGTGKEMFAHAIHNSSCRRGFPFVAVNCAALPASLLESEICGYEEGAFTGARKGGKPGLFELAHSGTIFLDEIGDMPLELQTRLLRVIEEREIMRVGGDSVIKVDVRIIAATNHALRSLVDAGRFRKDLYFRLNVLPLHVPPLRHRVGDALILAKTMCREFQVNFTLEPSVVAWFESCQWEGNVRELRNLVEYMANLGQAVIGLSDLPFCYYRPPGLAGIATGAERPDKGARDNAPDAGTGFVLTALARCFADQRRIGRRGLARQAKEFGLFLSEQEIRQIINRLALDGMVQVSRGRGGSVITAKGLRLANELTGLNGAALLSQ